MDDTNNTYPIRVRLTPHAIAELEGAEYGSYEDHILDDERLAPYDDGTLHCVEIVQRFKTVIVCNNQAEVDEVLGQSATGTWSIYCLRSALRLYWELYPHASEKAQNWIAPPNGL